MNIPPRSLLLLLAGLWACGPSPEPSPSPTDAPEPTPTAEPTPTVTAAPTHGPTASPEPTDAPTHGPTDWPEPTDEPTDWPEPTDGPTDEPTDEPTDGPEPTPEPTAPPTPEPTPTAILAGDADRDGVPTEDDCDDHAAEVGAADWRVGSGSAADFRDLQAAVSAAAPGDTVCVEAGVYFAPIVIDRSLTVWGAGGAENTIIEGDTNSRGVAIVDAGDTLLGGFTIRGSKLPGDDVEEGNGAGVLVLRSNATVVTQNIIEGNEAFTTPEVESFLYGVGGGLAVMDSNLVEIEGNVIRDNLAWSAGGLHVGDTSRYVTLKNNTITDNWATNDAGGIGLYHATDTVIEGNEIWMNTAEDSSGGVEIWEAERTEMIGNVVSENHAWGQGAGIVISNTFDIALSGNTLHGNVAGPSGSGYGGGLLAHGTTDLAIEGGTLTDNAAVGGAGALIWDAARVSLTDVTISGHRSGANNGAGIYALYIDTLTLDGLIIEDNSAAYGGGLQILGSRSSETGACDAPTTDVVIRDSLFASNTATKQGGAISADCVARLTLDGDTRFVGNIAAEFGGGLWADTIDRPSLVGARFEGNQARYGGGAYLYESTHSVVQDAVFKDNVANDYAGGLGLQGGSSLDLSGSTFEGNSVGWLGGGLMLYALDYTTDIVNNRFANNTSQDLGAGIYIGQISSTALAQTSFEGNSSRLGGAALFCDHAQSTGGFTLTQATFSGNSPTDTACNGCSANGTYCDEEALNWENPVGSDDDCEDEPDGCPTRVYDIKDGTVATGASVWIEDVIVTAEHGSAFYATVEPGSAGYLGPAYASIYIYNPGVSSQPVPGSRVNVWGTVGDYFGQIQLEASSVEVKAQGVAIPEALTVSPETVAEGGSLERAYEGHLVKVTHVTVINNNPEGQGGEDVNGEFMITGGLVVDDAIYLTQPFPGVGDGFASLTGVLRYTWGHNKLLPRDAADVIR